ncbi:bifunctional DNA primase/polymerase [Falsiroseomonas oryziterrae]|uniref:bifunctional DNA primase/polymerase n=1 Tax=Falsiroseomonas oryziterrae TaxID=2911368 RepID=UPI001F29B2F3|nr:bifunctional DNA primase/polymerase [Roseomonas sp. NPKOSM-4]
MTHHAPPPPFPQIQPSSETTRPPSPFERLALELHDKGLVPVACGGSDGKRPDRRFKTWNRARSRRTIEQLVHRRSFPTHNIGVATGCGARPVTIIDCDDVALADAVLEACGPTPLITATPSGGRHFWYAYAGERCENLRSDGLPIDIKGVGGLVIVPPSCRLPGPDHPGGVYAFICGDWLSLAHLTPMRPDALDRLDDLAAPDRAEAPLTDAKVCSPIDEIIKIIAKGERNIRLFRLALRDAPSAGSAEELGAILQERNKTQCRPPLRHKEVLRIARSAWRYQEEGRNWVGSAGVAQLPRAEFKALRSPEALWLLATLRFAHGSRQGTFAISPKAMARADAARGLGAATIRDSVRELLDAGLLEQVHRGGKGKGDASKYRLRPLSTRS